ncbi:heme binding [Homalodisca vitripennis]|nr:heme binding [Homalodisca vitripennis]
MSCFDASVRNSALFLIERMFTVHKIKYQMFFCFIFSRKPNIGILFICSINQTLVLKSSCLQCTFTNKAMCSYSRILKTKFHSQDLISLVLPTAMLLVGRVPVLDVILMWTYINMISSFWFGVIGLNAAHHHPEIFHYGDKPREDRDWGLHTLDATRDRVEVMGSPNLVLVTYGDHSLHHLFPTIDHVHLSSLYPIMEQTCREFGYNFKLKTTWDLVTGQFRQLMRNEPNLKDQNQ